MAITYPDHILTRPPVTDPGDRVALCGDWHGNIDRASRALYALADAGITTAVHVGDFLFGYDGAFTGNTERVSDLAAELGITVMFIDGNHDDHDFLRSDRTEPGFAPITDSLCHIRRGTVWTWRDRTWCGLGGAGSIDKFLRTPGVDYWDAEVVTMGQVTAALSALGEDAVDVIVTHERPSWSPRVVPKRSFGAAVDAHISTTPGLLAHLGEPEVWAYGHYHVRDTAYAPGRSTRFEALACDASPLWDNVITLDAETLATVLI